MWVKLQKKSKQTISVVCVLCVIPPKRQLKRQFLPFCDVTLILQVCSVYMRVLHVTLRLLPVQRLKQKLLLTHTHTHTLSLSRIHVKDSKAFWCYIFSRERWAVLMAVNCQVREHSELSSHFLCHLGTQREVKGSASKEREYTHTHPSPPALLNPPTVFPWQHTTIKVEWVCCVPHSGSVCVCSSLALKHLGN